MKALKLPRIALLGLTAGVLLLATPGDAPAYRMIGNGSCRSAPRPGPGLSSARVRPLPPVGPRHRVGITLYGLHGPGGMTLIFCRRLATGYPALGPVLLLGVFTFTAPRTVSRDLVLPPSFRSGSYKVIASMTIPPRRFPTTRIAYGIVR